MLGPRVERWRQRLGKIGLNIVQVSRNFFLRKTNPRELPGGESLQMKRLCMFVQVTF